MNAVLRVCAAALIAAAGAAHAETRAETLSPAQARAIAKDAYTYGFPLVDSYRIQYSYFVDEADPEYKAPWNHLYNNARVSTPDDKAIPTPDSDTPYSYVGADLRAEPLVLTVPAVEKGRYFSVQLIDAYTFNFAYIGSRTTGNGGGSFLLAGPDWKGEKPKGVQQVIRSETEFAFVLYRTQLFAPGDIANVRRIQAGYKVQPLSAFLGKPAPPAAPPIDFVKPIGAEDERTSLEFFDELNFVLQFCPMHPSEKALMERFARLDIGAGKEFDAKALTPEMRKAIEDGIADAWEAYDDVTKDITDGRITSGRMIGTRALMKNNYLYRFQAAATGIYGNSRDEAFDPLYVADGTGKKTDGASNHYTLRFAPGQLPPVNAFWSLTVYELPASLLYPNPLHRYLIDSPMLPSLKKDADGGITLYLQHGSPGEDKEANWLPVPAGPFVAGLRLYWPKPEVLNGRWKAPPLERVS